LYAKNAPLVADLVGSFLGLDFFRVESSQDVFAFEAKCPTDTQNDVFLEVALPGDYYWTA
jgi:hypothetical protein